MPKQVIMVLPDRVFEALDKIEKKSGYRKEDLILRAIVKVIDEYGGE